MFKLFIKGSSTFRVLKFAIGSVLYGSRLMPQECLQEDSYGPKEETKSVALRKGFYG